MTQRSAISGVDRWYLFSAWVRSVYIAVGYTGGLFILDFCLLCTWWILTLTTLAGTGKTRRSLWVGAFNLASWICWASLFSSDRERSLRCARDSVRGTFADHPMTHHISVQQHPVAVWKAIDLVTKQHLSCFIIRHHNQTRTRFLAGRKHKTNA